MKIVIDIPEKLYKALIAKGQTEPLTAYEGMIVSGTPLPKNHGRWIRHTRVEDVYDIAGVKTWGIKHQCDQCTFTTIAIEGFGYYDFCPNCGADMRKAESEDKE